MKSAAQASRAEPGLYTWPFSFTLTGDLPESVTWLPQDSYICYAITAEVTTGILSKTTRTTEHLRLIKSPSFWSDDLFFAPSVRPCSFHSTAATETLTLLSDSRAMLPLRLHLPSFATTALRAHRRRPDPRLQTHSPSYKAHQNPLNSAQSFPDRPAHRHKRWQPMAHH